MLGLHVHNVTASLDVDEKANHAIHAFARGATVVSESGLYAVIMRSRKPEAKILIAGYPIDTPYVGISDKSGRHRTDTARSVADLLRGVVSATGVES